VNITFPFKEEVMKYADIINLSSSTVKSSNTLLFKEKIFAENTDYTGFLRSYEFHFNKNKPKKILVLGGGGVGRAITFALGSLDVEHIYLYEKDQLRGQNLIKDLEFLKISCTLINSDKLEKTLFEVQGIVNCTPVGHFDFPGCPLGELLPSNHHWIFDVIYTPAKTDLLIKGEKVGAKIISGIDLFIFQALDAFLLFCGDKIDKDHISKQILFLRQHYFKLLYK
jgi:shikimate dehydrogenase